MAIKIIKALFLLFIAAFLILSVWLAWEFSSPPKTAPKEIFFEVEKGKAVGAIAKKLKEEGVIKKTQPFLLGYRLFFSPKSIKAGEYSLTLPLSAKEVLITLIEGKIHLHSLTIPEGLTAREIFELLASNGFGAGEEYLELFSHAEILSSVDTKARNLEGYLFPETYHFPKGTPAKKIVTTMVEQFKEVFERDLKRRAEEMGLTTREVVILASLLEKEAAIPEERKLVSAVFHNRLKRRMKLDCDPTIIYALKQEGQSIDRLRTKDLQYNTPYNTYLHPGLPPGPICNPGLQSLKAALSPAEEDYLYFVSKNDGSHLFSRTLKEHQRAVDLYQKRKNEN